MDIIFSREYKLFLKTLRLYINNHTSYQNLLYTHYRLIASTFPNLDHMREYIHTFKLNEYKAAMEFEKKLKELKEPVDDYNDVSQGLYQGCAKMDETTYHLPSYPMMNMLVFGDDGDESEPVKKEEYDFEF